MNLGGGWNWEAGHGRHKEKLKHLSDGQDILFFSFWKGRRKQVRGWTWVLGTLCCLSRLFPPPPYSQDEGETGRPSTHPPTNILFTLVQNLSGVRVAHFPNEAGREVTDDASFFSTAQSHLGRWHAYRNVYFFSISQNSSKFPHLPYLPGLVRLFITFVFLLFNLFKFTF